MTCNCSLSDRINPVIRKSSGRCRVLPLREILARYDSRDDGNSRISRASAVVAKNEGIIARNAFENSPRKSAVEARHRPILVSREIAH